MKNPIQRRLQAEGIKRLAETFLGKKNFSWWAIFYASLIFIVACWLPDGIADLIFTVDWFPDSIAELISREWCQGIFKLSFCVAILLFFGYKLKKATSYGGRIEVISESPAPCKVLAIFLSPLFRTLKPKELEGALTNNSLSKDMLVGSEWEMPVKAIEYHSQEIKRLYVLTSKDGTHELMELFKKTINRLFPNLEVIELESGGIDFENIKEVFNSVEKLYKEASKEGFRKEDIIVDITGGQKTNSIAGAIATLAIGRKFQYVSTRDKRVLSYDIGYFEE